MSGSAPTNSQAVDFERQQAAEADAKEAERQARLKQGQAAIDAIFDFSPATPASSKAFDWSTFKAPEQMPAAMSQWLAANPGATAPTFNTTGTVPAGYTAVQLPGGGWGLKDASGKIYKPGDQLIINTPAKAAGGFGPDFYNAYKQKILDYYDPQEAKQYAEAGRDLTYNLARAGTLTSSVAADKQGELAYQDALAKAQIVNSANNQTGQLQSQIQANKESLINQLYATEDPTLTANLAQSSANASQLKDPLLTPMAAFISPAATAVGSAFQNATSQFGLYPGQQGYGQQGAVPPPATGTGAGKLISG
jgi:hypothetical protein